MNVKEIVAYINIRQLSADECQSIMNALMDQPEVLTGGIVLKRELDFLADATCDENGISDEKTVKKTQKRAEEIFADHLRYGTDGDMDDIMQLSADQAYSEIMSEKGKKNGN